MIYLIFSSGLFLGVCIGIFVVALLTANKKDVVSQDALKRTLKGD